MVVLYLVARINGTNDSLDSNQVKILFHGANVHGKG